jgi:hypothetical protein
LCQCGYSLPAADCNITWCYGETAFSCCEAAATITKRFSHNLSKTKQTQQAVTSHTHIHTHYGGQTKISEIRTNRHRDTRPRAVLHTGTPSVCTTTAGATHLQDIVRSGSASHSHIHLALPTLPTTFPEKPLQFQHPNSLMNTLHDVSKYLECLDKTMD